MFMLINENQIHSQPPYHCASLLQTTSPGFPLKYSPNLNFPLVSGPYSPSGAAPAALCAAASAVLVRPPKSPSTSSPLP